MDLVYAAYARCPCGAGMAYRPGDNFWDCSFILLGKAIPTGQTGSVQHTAHLPFAFYEVKSENQPSAGMATTRETEYPLKLNAYQASNLKELFHILHGSVLDTGDWCGETRWMLDALNLGDMKPNQGSAEQKQRVTTAGKFRWDW